MATPARRSDDDPGAVDDLVAILRAAATGARTLGGAGISALADGTEAAVAAFVAARVRRAIDRGPDAAPRSLAEALAPPRSEGLAKRLGTTGAARLASRARPLARRSPTGIALRVGPALYDTAASTVREIDAIAAHLVALAGRHGRDTDAERLQTITVQILAGRPVDPTVRAPHAALVRRWVRRLGGQLAPFGLGGGGTDVAALTDALADVDPEDLGPKQRRRKS